MRPGPKQKVFSSTVLAQAVGLIHEGRLSLRAIAEKRLHTHMSVLCRNLQAYYGGAWEGILEVYRNRRGFRKGSQVGKAYWFKKGALRYINARRWKPIGAIQLKKYRFPKKKKFCYLKYIKITDIPNAKNWVLYARWLWEQNNGQVPEGLEICHLDGNKSNDKLDNLTVMKHRDIIRYLESRFPERLEERKRRNSISQKKRHAIGRGLVRVVRTFWQCAECAAEFQQKPRHCPKCNSNSIEPMRVRVA